MKIATVIAPPLLVLVLIAIVLAVFSPRPKHARPIWPACEYRDPFHGRSKLTGRECWSCHGRTDWQR